MATSTTFLSPAKAKEVCRSLQQSKEKGEVLNPHMINMERDIHLFYGPAFLCVTHMVAVTHEGRITNPACESVLYEVQWDHTHHSLVEAADAARRGGGRVYVSCHVLGPGDLRKGSQGVEPRGTTFVDEGPSFEVWPTWTGENQNRRERV